MGDNACESRMNWNKKYDLAVEQAILKWIEAVLECDLKDVQGHEKFRQRFKSGDLLCQLMNKISPGCIKTYKKDAKVPFQQMENLGFVNEAMRQYGVQSEYIFVTNDLYQGRNLYIVQLGLRNLGDVATSKGFQPAFSL